MKYLVTSGDGIQSVVESDKSLAHLALDYAPTTDILPLVETETDAPKPAKAKKSKEISNAG